MPELFVSDISAGARQRRVRVTWQDGAARESAVCEFGYQPDELDVERIRWYLEDFLEFPADPAPSIARFAESRLARAGTLLFQDVFSADGPAGLWAKARDRLGETRVQVDADPAGVPGLPWELLRDPGTGAAVALEAREFVRVHPPSGGVPDQSASAGDLLRVLLVICRPGGSADVPFRSVASQLVRTGADRMQGMSLEVLRPATFARLGEVLHAAARAGRPYHVVHFDGHGAFLDLATLGVTGPDGDAPARPGLSAAGPVRPGQHGYIMFEHASVSGGQDFVDGPTLGRLLTATQVPILVLNACRSAYAEAPSLPAGDTDELSGGTDPAGEADPGGNGAAEARSQAHSRIRGYGSLAAEVAAEGVPGVVAMRYNVYVVTAARFTADLYAGLLAGRSLGEAVTAARRALAAQPMRQIGAAAVTLQDWIVPVVYEAAPLTLMRSGAAGPGTYGDLPGPPDGGSQPGPAPAAPPPPEAGFFGRDETLLTLDRMFGAAPALVLLHAYAGQGKSATAGEFARWYQTTGGLAGASSPDTGRPATGPSAVLWTSFERYLPLERVVDAAGSGFAGLLAARGIQWQAVTDQGQRRDLLLDLLNEVPALWVWDNVEPVSGFPAGTPSAWTPGEQDELAGFLRDLLARTRCRVLLTSRRDERAWLGDLPARIELPPMPMRDRLQLAGGIASRHQVPATDVDWRPLLRYTAGNPLTIMVLMGLALRENLATTPAVEDFVARLRAGETDLSAGQDESLGRTMSLSASLGYGFSHAFTDAERRQLAVLHLFRDTLAPSLLGQMGHQPDLPDIAVPELSGLDEEAAVQLLEKAREIGLLTALIGGSYAIHPALPWYFSSLFRDYYPPPDDARVSRAYVHAVAGWGEFLHHQYGQGHGQVAILLLDREEGNLRHALALARDSEQWTDALLCLQGLRTLYTHTGRAAEWERLVVQATADFTDPATDGPLPGREEEWTYVTSYRVRLARDNRDWGTATRLQNARVARDEKQAETALHHDELTGEDRDKLRNLGVSYEYLGKILKDQESRDSLDHFQRALELYNRIGGKIEAANIALDIGSVYLDTPGRRDLNQAQEWTQRSLDSRSADDRVGQAACLSQLGDVANRRFRVCMDWAERWGDDPAKCLEHLNTTLVCYLQALPLTPPDNPQNLAVLHARLGRTYSAIQQPQQALQHFQEALRYHLLRGDVYAAGMTRFDIAITLNLYGNRAEAWQYARAALEDYQRAGQDAAHVRQLIAELEQRG